MNETLCHALLRARLTEEDVAARLQVDPKTVRRWLEGRVPYLRHRWALAALLGLDETDLWPQLRRARSRADEVQAVYPHLDAVPEEVWLRLFGSAERDIGILARTPLPVAGYPRVLDLLAVKAMSGVRIRICLARPGGSAVAPGAGVQAGRGSGAAETGGVFSAFRNRRGMEQAEFRLLRSILYAAIYRADDQLLVSQQVSGVPAGAAPVLHLSAAEKSNMVAAYLASFAEAWSRAQPLG